MNGQKSGWKYALVVMGLGLMAFLVMDFNSRMAELNRLTAERVLVRDQLGARMQTQASLETQIAHATSEAAVVQWAYQDGHLVRQGDVPVVPMVDQDVRPTSTPRAVITVEVKSNLERWFDLFFGP
jgi:hypothetical protein